MEYAGVAVCSSLLGGTFSAGSEPGKGAAFRMRIGDYAEGVAELPRLSRKLDGSPALEQQSGPLAAICPESRNLWSGEDPHPPPPSSS